MEYTKNKWKLTDQEIERITASGGNIAEAQKAKKQAYLDSGGVILNPDALPDLYEACIIARGFLACYEDKAHKEIADIVKQAIAKAEGK